MTTDTAIERAKREVERAAYRRHVMLATEAADLEFSKLTYRQWEERRESEWIAALDHLIALSRATGAVEGGVCEWQHGRACVERKPNEEPCPWCRARTALTRLQQEGNMQAGEEG